MRTTSLGLGVVLAVLAVPAHATAQTLDVLGTRAQGMGGAFVGVADDASAVYWNPAGLAGGAYFSLVLDGSRADALPDDNAAGARRSARLLALSTPAFGLSYYRLSDSVLRPSEGTPGAYRLDVLSTQHVGATLVQSLTDSIAVGTTLKVVRGLAGSAEVPAGNPEDLLDGWDIVGRSGNKFDLDVGVMATGALGRIGLTVRNLTAPAFETGGGVELRLERQVRGGASIMLLDFWRLAADVDLTRSRGAFGDVREFALGTEAQVTPRLAARAGLRINTAGEQGRTPAASVGASFAAVRSLLVDAHVTAGSAKSLTGWGIAGRLVF